MPHQLSHGETPVRIDRTHMDFPSERSCALTRGVLHPCFGAHPALRFLFCESSLHPLSHCRFEVLFHFLGNFAVAFVALHQIA
jgi:hypothetical protein